MNILIEPRLPNRSGELCPPTVEQTSAISSQHLSSQPIDLTILTRIKRLMHPRKISISRSPRAVSKQRLPSAPEPNTPSLQKNTIKLVAALSVPPKTLIKCPLYLAVPRNEKFSRTPNQSPDALHPASHPLPLPLPHSCPLVFIRGFFLSFHFRPVFPAFLHFFHFRFAPAPRFNPPMPAITRLALAVL